MFLKELRDRKLNKIIRQVDKKNIVSRYFWLLVGCFIVAFAFNVFFLQYNLVCIGITGLSIVLQKYMEPSKLILIINIVLIILSFIILGKEKTKNSIIGAIIIPVLVSLTKPLVPFFNLDGLEPIVIAILGGVLTGFGYGLIFKNGFTGGGTDIINQLAYNFEKAKFLMYFVTPNWDLSIYLFGKMPQFEPISLPFSIMICVIYFVIMVVASLIIFNKKDIKNI